MSSTQQFLVIGGLVLLSILALNFYRASDIQYNMKYENEAIITATSIAQSTLEEISTKAFDEVTTEWKTDSKDSLTLAASFGTDSAEITRTLFDDIDDYHGYYFVDSTLGLGNFAVSIIVNYVTPSDPNTLSATRTFTKKATIFVNNSYLKNELQYIYAYSY
jgi:hypothetical protein